MTLLQGDGRIIVAAAGNEGFDYIHAGATLQKENTVAIWHYPDNDMEMFNEIWYEKGAISNYRVAAIGVNDDGLYLAGYSDWQSVNTSNLDEERGLEIMDLATESPAGYLFHHSLNSEDMYNGDGQIYLKVWDGYEANSGLPYSAINDYIWVTFLFSGGDGGRFDMTVNSGATLPTEPGPFGVTFIPGDRDHSVGTPATSDSVISVGAFVSTNAWDVPGEGTYSLQYPADINWTTAYTPAIGEAAYFSSRGPTRDGRLAPVISAPGDKIFSARSFDIPDEVYPGTGMFLRENGHYVTMQGTSMAAPHITGIIALMLQIDPTLNYGDIVDIFSRSVTTDELT
jgi:subtilisin family serine protease